MANLKSWITYGFCFAILQLVIGCGQAPIDEQTSQAGIAEPEQQAIADPEADMLILAFGDSLYAGYGLPPKEGFVPELEKALKANGQDVKVHNAGVSGDTTAAGLRRMDFVLDSLPRAPDLVILGLGANDLLRGLKPEETQANMEAMVKIIVDHNIPVMLTGMLAPPNLGQDYSQKFNAIYPYLSRKYNTGLYPFFMDGLIGRPDLVLADGIHPNEKGIDIIVEKITPQVAALIEN